MRATESDLSVPRRPCCCRFRLMVSVSPLPVWIKQVSAFCLTVLNGCRCAAKLNIGIVPYLSLADDEPGGIIELMRISNAKSLSILEQARLIDELINVHQICNAEIATLLERSKAWVSVQIRHHIADEPQRDGQDI